MYIRGIGCHVPEKELDNAALAAMVDTTDEWIRTRTGICARRVAAKGQTCSDLALGAARQALAASGLSAESVTHIIVCTASGDAAFPSTACFVQQKLHLARAMAFDLGAACSGFLYGMQVARGLLAVSPEAVILLIGAEVLTHLVNWQDRGTCVLFGDGAGACVLSAGPAGSSEPDKPGEIGEPAKPGKNGLTGMVEGILCEGSADAAELLYCNGGGARHPYAPGDVVGEEYSIHMNGREVFKLAVRAMAEVSARLLEERSLTLDDIDLVLPHQANLRIINGVLDRLGLPREKAFLNLDKYGNTSAASIPLALAEAAESGALRPGMRALLVTFGAGLTWGAAVVKF